jgi:hypothetical protein
MPNGVANVSSDWVDGDLVFRDKDGYVIVAKLGSVGVQHGGVLNIRARFTIAQINAGVTLLPAVTNFGYRMVDAYAVAYGGAVGATTGVDLTATLSTSRKLVAFKQAGLTQSTMLRAGAATNGVLLADGASFTRNDVNTAITVIKDGSDLTTATGVDISFSFVIEA